MLDVVPPRKAVIALLSCIPTHFVHGLVPVPVSVSVIALYPYPYPYPYRSSAHLPTHPLPHPIPSMYYLILRFIYP